MTKKITKLDEIDFEDSSLVEFEGTVLSIASPGDQSAKRPIKFLGKIEGTGDIVQVVTWDYGLLSTLDDLVESTKIILVSGNPNISYNQKQLRLVTFEETNRKSTTKILHKNKSETQLKRDYTRLISEITDRFFKDLLNTLIMKNENFFKWPAATAIHHNYPSGLAIHSLNVCKHAISLWETYEGECMDRDLIVTGSLLHDIGKLQEYNVDGSRTMIGDLIGHPVLGSEVVGEVGRTLIQNNDDRRKLMLLQHIIISHHGKLEFGAAVMPKTLEAVIVSDSDFSDARVESVTSQIRNIPNDSQTLNAIIPVQNKMWRTK